MKFEEAMDRMKKGHILKWDGTNFRMVQIIKQWGGEIEERFWELQEYRVYSHSSKWEVCDEVPFEAIMSDDWNEAKK